MSKIIDQTVFARTDHPDPKRIREFVARLRAVITPERNLCSMAKVRVTPECDCPGCHGGWALIALSDDVDGDEFRVLRESFKNGAMALAGFIGFQANLEGIEELEWWAHGNPSIWGSRQGGYMFSAPEAFGQDEINFHAVILADWWEKVAERLEAELFLLNNT